MKNILIVICTCIVGGHLIAQNNVGIGILSPNPKALLDLTSNNKGFLAPRMTSAERIAIAPSSTEQGLLVFDTDTKFYYFWDGVQWIQLPGNNAFNISLTFDSITQTLTITDNGGALSTVLNFAWPQDNDTDSTNELINGMVFNNNGKILTINEGGNTWSTTINVEDADADPTNEFNLSFGLSGTVLSLTDGGGTLSVNLASLAAQNDDWKLTGNAGTNVNTHYIGTSDAVGLSIRTNATERIRITANTGYVGIGVQPSFILDVGDRMRLRAGNNNTAGCWYMNATNTQNRAFIGMIDDDRIGIYGSGMNNWYFRTNVNDGSTFIWGKTTISRDNIPECCGNDATLALAENTPSTGRVSSISFHNVNSYQGQMSLVTDATGLGVAAGRIRLSTSGLSGSNMGLQITGGVYYGNNDSRTETRTNAGLQGNAGAQSGFFEFNQPSGSSATYNYPPGYSGNTWWHLIDSRHSNPANNFAMQIAGNFFDQRIFYRKTNNNPSTAWNEFVTSANVNSFIINNNAPFISITRYNFGNGDNITFNTGVSATQFSAVIAGMNSAQSSETMTSIRCYMFKQGGTWWLRYDNRSSVDNLEFVDVMFINTAVVVSDNR